MVISRSILRMWRSGGDGNKIVAILDLSLINRVAVLSLRKLIAITNSSSTNAWRARGGCAPRERSSTAQPIGELARHAPSWPCMQCERSGMKQCRSGCDRRVVITVCLSVCPVLYVLSGSN